MFKKLFLNAFLVSLLFAAPSLAGAVGCDADTTFLTHANGVDAATTFTDENCDGSGAKTITAGANAQVDTAVKKFGTGAALLDGVLDNLTVPDDAAWDFLASNTGTRTIDWWINFSASGFQTVFWQGTNTANYWQITFDTGGMGMYSEVAGVAIINTARGGTFSASTWHHVAFIKKGDGSTKEIGIYLDGAQVKYLADADVGDFAGTLYIGSDNSGLFSIVGSMDEIHFSNSNYFNASPNVGLTDTIIVPSAEYEANTRRRFIIGYKTSNKWLRAELVKALATEDDVYSFNYNGEKYILN